MSVLTPKRGWERGGCSRVADYKKTTSVETSAQLHFHGTHTVPCTRRDRQIFQLSGTQEGRLGPRTQGLALGARGR